MGQLLVALDVESGARAVALARSLRDIAGGFKIGSRLFTLEGPGLVRQLVDSGVNVFLDLKFHDIPNTVASAAESASRLGVSIFNVHALGGGEMMRAAADSVKDRGILWMTRPAVLGVTVLTSMDESNLAEVGVNTDMNSEVVRLATLARDSGLDGVVASPREIRLIREFVASEGFIILTPGIRPAGSATGDQKRTATPLDAIRDGADFLVIGRAITSSDNPRAVAQRLLDEIGA